DHADQPARHGAPGRRHVPDGGALVSSPLTPGPSPQEGRGEQYMPTERRPIASRNLRIVQWLATCLVRLNVSPNAISIAGMLCAIAGGCTFAATAWWPDWQRFFWLAAAV